MNGELDVAEELLTNCMPDLRARPVLSYARLFSRAAMMLSTIALFRFGPKDSTALQAANKLIKEGLGRDPLWHYATYTRAQIVGILEDHDRGKESFRNAYENIQQSGELVTVREARSRVLLLMLTASCMKQFSNKPAELLRADKHLEEANSCLLNLPRRGDIQATVFSPPSKKNEPLDLIKDHIEQIAEGTPLAIKRVKAIGAG
jgi:hypothetical protein